MKPETRNEIGKLIELFETFEKKGTARYYDDIRNISDRFPEEYEGETELHTDQLRGEFEVEIEMIIEAHGPRCLRYEGGFAH